jgi:hypothetical protein
VLRREAANGWSRRWGSGGDDGRPKKGVFLQENEWLLEHVPAGSYRRKYKRCLDNSIYRPLIDELLSLDAEE